MVEQEVDMRVGPRVLLAAAALAAAAVAAPSSAGVTTTTAGHTGLLQLSAPATAEHAAQSQNWFGYNKGFMGAGKRFSSISGTFVVPTATWHPMSTSTVTSEASSTWVGIGGGCLKDGCANGLTDATLIQAGTEQDVDKNGTQTYYAWWELIPAPEVKASLPVHPGDTVRVQIAQQLPGLWHIEIDNVTTGQAFSKTVPYTSTGGSAEWIEETPLLIGVNAGFADLPYLSKVPFTAAKVNGTWAGLQPSEEMDLVTASGQVIGVPSAPTSTGTGFDACAWATSCT